MDTKSLVVGQKVWIFGCGWFEGVVVRLLPDGGVEVATDWAVTQFVNKDTNWAVAQFDNKGTDGSVAQFDNKGNETDDSRYRRLGCLQNGPGPEWGPWELRERDRGYWQTLGNILTRPPPSGV